MTATSHLAGRAAPKGWHVAALGVLAGVAAIAAASLGTNALYLTFAAIGAGGFTYVIRGQLAPLVDDGTSRAARFLDPTGARPLSPAQRRLLGVCLPLAAGFAAFGAATAGLLVAVAAAALPLLFVGGWFAWPAVRELVLTPPEDLTPRTSPVLGTTTARTAVGSLGSLLVVAAAGVAAFFVSGLGFKGVLVAAATLAGGTALIVVRDRSSFGMFAATVSLTFVLHKSFSAQYTTVSGGAISVFITTFDAMLLVLVGLWIAEGTFLSDLRAGMRRKVMWTPLIGALFLLPSMLAASTPLLAVAELTRMGWMYLLFVYVAVRVRTRRQVGLILAGLGAFAAIEVAVILMQWKTGGVLGLEFLGVPKELGERVTDTASLGRPFGTIIHPVFMGAVMSAIGLMALSFALGRRNGLARTAGWLTLAASMGAMYISHTRAAMVAFVAVGAWVVWGSWRRGEVTTAQLKRVALAGLACFVIALPLLIPKFEENFGTGHFYEEIDSRQQLNVIGLHMWTDHPFVGVGLNNFEQVMGPYQRQGIIFFNNPVHNLYLLYLAETGLVGFVGFLITCAGAAYPAFRLARARDPFLRSVGRGVAAAAIFFGVEELLGFSLRQDIPLALFWLLAGLAVAGLNIAEHEGVTFGPASGRPRRSGSSAVEAARSPKPRGARSGSPSTSRWAQIRPAVRPRWVPLLAVAPLLLTTIPSSTSGAETLPAGAPADVVVVFGATDRATGQTGIYVTGPDRRATRITPADGKVYSWPQFAFGSTKVVYTVRTGEAGSPESIYVMNPDGSSPELVRDFPYRVAQPKVSPDGTSLVFTAQSPWYPQVGVYRMDLGSGQIANLSAQHSSVSGADSDPVYSSDGKSIVFAQTLAPNTQIAVMDPDGNSRRDLTADPYSNVDPDLSPDQRDIVYSSYRGQGSARDDSGALAIRVGDWKIVSQPVTAHTATRELTQGLDCTTRTPDNPCTPDMASGFKPRYSPDGSTIGFVAALDDIHTCICTIGVDGSSPDIYLASGNLAIDWFDWVRADSPAPRPFSPPPAPADPGTLLVSEQNGRGTIWKTGLDFADQVEIPLPEQYDVTSARWGRDGQIVFSARGPLNGVSHDPHPLPPPGSARREHFTYTDLFPTYGKGRAVDIGEQLFLRRVDGRVTRLTDPWTEDWRDGLREGDARSNTGPRVAPDGLSVTYTSTSSLTGESFVMRLDLRTGAVLNLTNGTSGAAWVDDASPALSPAGDAVVFTTTLGSSDIWTMDAATGYRARRVTDDAYPDLSPVMTPDGASIVYVSYRGAGEGATTSPQGLVTLEPTGWVLIRLDRRSGAKTMLTDVRDPDALQPEVDPSGRWVYFLRTTKGSGPRLHRVPVDGSQPPTVVNGDVRNHRSVDFR